jgi:hypothetical protein
VTEDDTVRRQLFLLSFWIIPALHGRPCHLQHKVDRLLHTKVIMCYVFFLKKGRIRVLLLPTFLLTAISVDEK